MLLGESCSPVVHPAPGYSGSRLAAYASHNQGRESSVEKLSGSIEQSSSDSSIHDMQRMLAQIKESQERQELHLFSLTLQQSQSKNVTGSSVNKDIENFFERLEIRLDKILRKMEIHQEKHDELVCTTVHKAQPVQGVEKEQAVSEAMGVEGGSLLATGGNATPDKVSDPVRSNGVAKAGMNQEVLKASDAEWKSIMNDIHGFGHQHSKLYKDLMVFTHPKQSVWHHIFKKLGLSSCLATEEPQNVLAKVIFHPVFIFLSEMIVFANACLLAYDTDAEIKVALQQPGAQHIEWMPTCNIIFNIIFAVEVLFRIGALGSWFLVSPEDWAWNIFDLVVVPVSLFSNLHGGGNVTFLRVFRLVRAVRIIRILRAFRELRKMLLAMLASMMSLFWAFVFLAFLMFIISILVLQGLAGSLNEMHHSAEYSKAASLALPLYGSMALAMFSLLRAFTGGTEWYAVYEPLEVTEPWVQCVFVLCVLFVIVGTFNILTGLFLANADDVADRDMLIQDYCIKTEDFVRMMLELFAELGVDRTGELTKEVFLRALEHDQVQAYIAAYGLYPLQARLIFDLLDEHHTGKINLVDFVFGMNRLKGHATAVDSKTIVKEVSMLPESVTSAMLRFTPHASDERTMV